MANKITELNQENQRKAEVKDESIAKKLQEAEKKKEEQLTIQKAITQERLNKWKEKKTKQEQKDRLSEKRRVGLASKLSKEHGSELRQRQLSQLQEEVRRHNETAEKVKLERQNLLQRN